MPSKAATVDASLDELSDDRRETIASVRDVVRKNLPAGLIETIGYGMITYAVPAENSPKSCNGEPMMLIGLSSGKQYCSLHLMCLYMNKTREDALRQEFQRIGKKLDMGKACIRFKRAEDLALDVLAEAIRRVAVEAYVRHIEAAVAERKNGARKQAKPAAKRNPGSPRAAAVTPRFRKRSAVRKKS